MTLPLPGNLDPPFGKPWQPPQGRRGPVGSRSTGTGNEDERQDPLTPCDRSACCPKDGAMDADESAGVNRVIKLARRHATGERLPARHEAVLALGQTQHLLHGAEGCQGPVTLPELATVCHI